ncbi:MAG: glycosyltransferase family 4 protein [Planctomycetota bacterium]|jgi:colanic acid biosynthesis glycosyl transferase WcaI
MRILIPTLYFAPDVGANAEIVTGLAEGLAAQGHDVTVVTAFPHYDQNRIWDEYRGRLFQRDRNGRIQVVRTYLYVPQSKTNILGRLLNYASFNVLSTLAALGNGPCELILAPSPPLTIGLTAYVLSRLWGVPYVYNVQDIYPDVAVRLGVLENPRLIRFFRWMEDFIYSKAKAVTVLSEGFRRNLLGKGVPERKIHIIPNFVDVSFVRPLSRDNAFARSKGLHEKFVVMYAGNVGLSQNLEIVLDAADELRDLTDVQFLIVGNGSAKERLVARSAGMGLDNVRFLSFQPREDLPEMYASADLCLVTLRPGLADESVPSKAYTIMASERPMLAAVDRQSEVKRLIDAADCGVWVEPADPSALAAHVRRLHGDPVLRERLGRNGRRYVVQHYTPQVAASQYHELLVSLDGHKLVEEYEGRIWT